MFRKQEAQQLKKEFWTAFGKSFPRKWILYHTKIRDFSFKFSADRRRAEVSLDIEMKDEFFRNAYFEKFQSLEKLLTDEIGEDLRMDDYFVTETGKTIARIWVTKDHVSVFDKNTWQDIFEFFVARMDAFERFYLEYEDYIRDI